MSENNELRVVPDELLSATLAAFHTEYAKLRKFRKGRPISADEVTEMAKRHFIPMVSFAERGWLPIDTAPKDEPIDILGKIWDPGKDAFFYHRFTDCRWHKPDVMSSRFHEYWNGVDKQYRPEYWRPIHLLPKIASND